MRFLVSVCVTRSSVRVGEFWTLVSIQSGGILGYQNYLPIVGVFESEIKALTAEQVDPSILDVRRLTRLRYSTGFGAIDGGELYCLKARGVQHDYR